MSAQSSPPLTGIRVVELAGLAPVPYCGLLLADFGATVLRIDRAQAGAHTSRAPRTNDNLTRNKTSIALDLKDPSSKALLLSILSRADVLIEPFRPGVLEKLGLGPETLHKQNPRLIIARLTGFRRDGKYKDMAGHDINYLAVSGVLSQLGRANSPPYPPANLLGDFAGGGLMCAYGVVLAIFARQQSGRGQVLASNMVDGVSSLGTMPRLGKKMGWNRARGANLLDGGSPFYDTFATKDGRYMAVGALEPQFFTVLIQGMGLSKEQQTNLENTRLDPDTWPEMRALFTKTFREKTRDEWEQIFDGKDACCTPVLEQEELERQGHEIRAAVHLSHTPARNVVSHESYESPRLPVGQGGEETLREWMGWKRGVQYRLDEKRGALVQAKSAKL